MWPAFQVRVPGKWVLTGEHSVLRGATAIALPHVDYGLSLNFEPDDSLGRLVIEPETAVTVVQNTLRCVQKANEKQSIFFPFGVLRIESSIPIGAGFGSSAALCVALSRWMSVPLAIEKKDFLSFATHLEHQFHGKSSGMDIAVIAAGRPVSFSMKKGPQALNIQEIPRFTFHDTHVRSQTRSCVEQVEEQGRAQPILGRQYDETMGSASQGAFDGLFLFDSGRHQEGLALIITAMKQAQECFYAWGLVPPEAARLEAELFKQGALAVKMTGAGGGGMMVALWGRDWPGLQGWQG